MSSCISLSITYSFFMRIIFKLPPVIFFRMYHAIYFNTVVKGTHKESQSAHADFREIHFHRTSSPHPFLKRLPYFFFYIFLFLFSRFVAIQLVSNNNWSLLLKEEEKQNLQGTLPENSARLIQPLESELDFNESVPLVSSVTCNNRDYWRNFPDVATRFFVIFFNNFVWS